MIEQFKVGFRQFSSLWKEIFCAECFDEIRRASHLGPKKFDFATEVWVKTLYELAATFHGWTANRQKLIDLVTPLYYARVAAFVRQSLDMDSQTAEALVEEQAMAFENHKEYLIQVWDQRSGTGKAA